MDQYNSYIGRTLDDRYKLKRIVGEGGMAVVFEADDLFRKMVVAVKILKDEFASDEVSVQCFINESKAVLMLSHTNIVKIFDISVKGENKYIVMEYIDGITLKTYMERKGALSEKEAISYSIQILRALEHAHIGGIIHRDIKPQNIMLLKNGQIKVTDFGIAKLPDAKTLTATDKAIGTVYYISPEQAAGEKGIDRRTDLYSVGVMMYEMLTGKLPFDGENPVSIALKQINEEPKAPTEIVETIPKGLEQIVLFAMEKDKDKRFQTATQMIELLQKIRENPLIVFRQKKAPEKKKNKVTIVPIILGVAIAFFLVAIVSAGFVLYQALFSEEATAETYFAVDDYVGKTFDNKFYEELSRTYRVKVEYEYSEEYPRDQIIKQKPEAGQPRSGSDLTLYVSQGTEDLVMNSYAYADRRLVENELRGLGLIVGEIVQEYNSVIPTGSVINTVPGTGESVSVGDRVTIIVSMGDPVEMAIVPSFAGATIVEAYELLVESDHRFGTPTYVYNDEVPENVVIDQLPVAGTEVPKDVTKITFIISKGKAPNGVQIPTRPIIPGLTTSDVVNPLPITPVETTTSETTIVVYVPSCIGASSAEAYRILDAGGFEFGTATYVYSDTVPYGVIISQSPAAGTGVPNTNKKVNFTISNGPNPATSEAPIVVKPIVTTTSATTTTEAPVVTTSATTTTAPPVVIVPPATTSATTTTATTTTEPPVVITDPPVVITVAPPVIVEPEPVVTTAEPEVTEAPVETTTATTTQDALAGRFN